MNGNILKSERNGLKVSQVREAKLYDEHIADKKA